MSHLMMRRAIVTAVSLAALAGGAATVSPAASAAPMVGPSKCSKNYDYKNFSSKVLVRIGLNLRSGPGTGYTKKGTLPYHTGLWVGCGNGTGWVYVKVTSGAYKNTYGWVLGGSSLDPNIDWSNWKPEF